MLKKAQMNVDELFNFQFIKNQDKMHNGDLIYKVLLTVVLFYLLRKLQTWQGVLTFTMSQFLDDFKYSGISKAFIDAIQHTDDCRAVMKSKKWERMKVKDRSTIFSKIFKNLL